MKSESPAQGKITLDEDVPRPMPREDPPISRGIQPARSASIQPARSVKRQAYASPTLTYLGKITDLTGGVEGSVEDGLGGFQVGQP